MSVLCSETVWVPALKLFRAAFQIALTNIGISSLEDSKPNGGITLALLFREMSEVGGRANQKSKKHTKHRVGAGRQLGGLE